MRAISAESRLEELLDNDDGDSGAASTVPERAVLARRKKVSARSVDCHLPVAIERILVGVEAGLDIVPAIRAAVESAVELAGEYRRPDPVLETFRRILALLDGGMRLEDALDRNQIGIDVPALAHALMFLRQASLDGASITAALRELADATQRRAFDQIEEQIAGLPVKATVPLTLIFAGMLSILLTAPIVRVLEFFQRGGAS